MTSGSAPDNRLRFWRSTVAGFIAAGFFWMIALSVSPALHASIHTDSTDMAHHCGATLVASGNCQDSPSVAPFSAPTLLPALTPVRVITSAAQPPFLVVRVLEHAPPFAA